MKVLAFFIVSVAGLILAFSPVPAAAQVEPLGSIRGLSYDCITNSKRRKQIRATNKKGKSRTFKKPLQAFKPLLSETRVINKFSIETRRLSGKLLRLDQDEPIRTALKKKFKKDAIQIKKDARRFKFKSAVLFSNITTVGELASALSATNAEAKSEIEALKVLVAKMKACKGEASDEPTVVSISPQFVFVEKSSTLRSTLLVMYAQLDEGIRGFYSKACFRDLQFGGTTNGQFTQDPCSGRGGNCPEANPSGQTLLRFTTKSYSSSSDPSSEEINEDIEEFKKRFGSSVSVGFYQHDDECPLK